MKKLRIAQIAPLIERVPPKKYGGTERMIYALTEELVIRGHEVTLFASGDSQTSAHLTSVYPRSLREVKMKNMYGLNEINLMHVAKPYMSHKEFDLIHDHSNYLSLLPAYFVDTPVVMTLHGAFTPSSRLLYQMLDKPHYIAISQAQATNARGVRIDDVVYNGLNMLGYPYGEKPDNMLLYVGRLSLEKGVHIAIQVAQELAMPLVIAAKLDRELPEDMQYFHQYIEPSLSDDLIRFVGEVTEEERNKLMSAAKAFLHPVTWPEPFGLTLIESMACGTPIVAFGRGSIPEVVQNGKTGFVVQDIEGMIEAVQNIDKISRADTRQYALSHFNQMRMTDAYEKVYEKILSKSTS